MATYAVSDLHGHKQLWDQIKAFLKPDDTLYILGDIADRGPAGWAMLKEALSDPRIIYIKGNHDVMLADALARPNSYKAIGLHYQNGGRPTAEAAAADTEETRKEIMLKIRQAPLFAKYTNADGLRIFMSHSGYCDETAPDEFDFIWDRTNFLCQTNWWKEELDLVVFGHTPIPNMIEKIKESNKFFEYSPEKQIDVSEEWQYGAYYIDDWKCNIDCGAIWTNQTVLLDLDTLDEHIFMAN